MQQRKREDTRKSALSYTIGDAYTLDYWKKTAKNIEEMGADSICIKDMAGLLVPNEATRLVTALKQATDIPIELQYTLYKWCRWNDLLKSSRSRSRYH